MIPPKKFPKIKKKSRNESCIWNYPEKVFRIIPQVFRIIPGGIPNYPRRYSELSQEVFRIIPGGTASYPKRYSELSQQVFRIIPGGILNYPMRYFELSRTGIPNYPKNLNIKILKKLIIKNIRLIKGNKLY